MSLDRAKLVAAIGKRKFVGRPFEHHATLASTQLRARELAADGAPEGALVVAEEQTEGRGRLGRPWVSPLGGLYVSIVLRPDDALLKRAPITLIAGLAASEALDSTARIATSLKWPNDILLEGKKIGGVLADLSKEKNKGNVLIVGVGLNVDVLPGAFPPDVRETATSVLAAKGRSPAIEDVLARFLDQFESHYEHVRRGGGPLLLSRAADRMPLLRSRVRARVEGKTIEGQAAGLTATGALVVSLEHGQREVIYAGEVEEVGPA